MKPLEETVTVRRPVDPRIADLVYFARSLSGYTIDNLSDDQLVTLAKDFWDTQHGED